MHKKELFMFIATMNFKSKEGFVKAGQEVENPAPHHIRMGLVKEVKIIKPEAKTDDVDKQNNRRTRKPRINKSTS